MLQPMAMEKTILIPFIPFFSTEFPLSIHLYELSPSIFHAPISFPSHAKENILASPASLASSASMSAMDADGAGDADTMPPAKTRCFLTPREILQQSQRIALLCESCALGPRRSAWGGLSECFGCKRDRRLQAELQRAAARPYPFACSHGGARKRASARAQNRFRETPFGG